MENIASVEKIEKNKNIEKIEKIIQTKFNNFSLLEQAFRHSSFANKHGENSNERLEFLGDSVLNFVTTDFLYANFSEEEGYLSKLKAYLVSAENLGNIIKKLGLIEFLKCENFNPSKSLNVMCDLFEAVVGAIYLDSGLENAKMFIYKNLQLEKQSILDKFKNVKDYKTKLQEMVQKSGKNTIEYALTQKTGKADNLYFTISLSVNGVTLATASAKSKKEAESLCAKIACEKLENHSN